MCISLQIPALPLPLFSLELRDLEGYGAGKVQEEGSFLFGQEGCGSDVVDACWDVVQLQVTETTSVISAALLLKARWAWIPD